MTESRKTGLYNQYLNLLAGRVPGAEPRARITRVEGTQDHCPLFICTLYSGPYVGSSVRSATKRAARRSAAECLINDKAFRAWIEQNAVRPMPDGSEDMIPSDVVDVEALRRNLDLVCLEKYGALPRVDVCGQPGSFNVVMMCGPHMIGGYGKTIEHAVGDAYMMLDNMFNRDRIDVEADKAEAEYVRMHGEVHNGKVYYDPVIPGDDSPRMALDTEIIAVPPTRNVKQKLMLREVTGAPDRLGITAVPTPATKPLKKFNGVIHVSTTNNQYNKFSQEMDLSDRGAIAEVDDMLRAQYLSVDMEPVVMCDEYIDQIEDDLLVESCKEESRLIYIHDASTQPRETIQSSYVPGSTETSMGMKIVPHILSAGYKYVCFITQDPTIKQASELLAIYGVPSFVFDSPIKLRAWIQIRKEMSDGEQDHMVRGMEKDKQESGKKRRYL